MKIVFVAGMLSMVLPLSAFAQTGPDNVGQAYAQFLLGHHLEEVEDLEGAIAAYKRAMALDPSAADATAELAALYLRQNRIQEALTTAEQALKITPANAEANRVMGIVHAALAETEQPRDPIADAGRGRRR